MLSIGQKVRVFDLVELLEKKFFIDDDGDLINNENNDVEIFEDELEHCGKILYIEEIRTTKRVTRHDVSETVTYYLCDEEECVLMFGLSENVFEVL